MSDKPSGAEGQANEQQNEGKRRIRSGVAYACYHYMLGIHGRPPGKALPACLCRTLGIFIQK